MTPTDEKDYYTISGLAKETHVSPKTVWAWINSGRLESYKYATKRHRISVAAWKEFLAISHRIKTAKDEQSKEE